MASDGYMVPARKGVRHYYGDTVRVLFVSGAVLLVIAETTGAHLPLSPLGVIVSAVLLVVAAGITNPEQGWIHFANEAIAVVGTLVFASSAIGHWRDGAGIFDSTYLFVEIIALLSLLSLYFTTKTIRGTLLRPHLS
ncbi:MAG: hypothetical protein Q7S95_02485 [bacterium]|nr:hypothetical protein [bacterium]